MCSEECYTVGIFDIVEMNIVMGNLGMRGVFVLFVKGHLRDLEISFQYSKRWFVWAYVLLIHRKTESGPSFCLSLLNSPLPRRPFTFWAGFIRTRKYWTDLDFQGNLEINNYYIRFCWGEKSICFIGEELAWAHRSDSETQTIHLSTHPPIHFLLTTTVRGGWSLSQQSSGCILKHSHMQSLKKHNDFV